MPAPRPDLRAAPRYWSQDTEGKIRCSLCPRRCVIADGHTGHCGARANSGGSMVLPFFGCLSSIAVDPIEKKPLRRFMPGTRTFSTGFWGCNMDCPFCQNHEISHPAMHAAARSEPFVSPDEFVAMALDSAAPSVSYTYSEPCIHAEYVTACMERAHDAGLKNILVTNGCILSEAARDILMLTDATNVDLKCNSASTYHAILGGELDVVQSFIQIAAKLTHVEVTTLIVPGISDSETDIEGIARFLSSVSTEIPLHITRYHPDFRMNLAPTEYPEMERIAAPAYDHLKYVYLHNPHSD